MKLNRGSSLAALGLLAFMCVTIPVRAQEKESPSAEVKKLTQVKVTVVIVEMEGTKKVSSLPYTLYVNTDDAGGQPTSQVRFGLRVPITTTTSGNVNPHVEYLDLNTNLDCRASAVGDSRIKLNLSMDRNITGTERSVEALGAAAGEKKSAGTSADGSSNGTPIPIVQHFSSSYNLLIHDGQTLEATSVTDPFTGHTLLVSVTANVVK
jgi:hypothetical protein